MTTTFDVGGSGHKTKQLFATVYHNYYINVKLVSAINIIPLYEVLPTSNTVAASGDPVLMVVLPKDLQSFGNS